MSYETAPATLLLATHCACCARPLVDATSVETGVGPECRKRHGYADAQGEPNWEAVLQATDDLVAIAELFPNGLAAAEAAWRLGGLETRRVANLIVHRIATRQQGPDVLRLTNALAALGFAKLAARIAQRVALVRIELDAGEYLVRTPYTEEGVCQLKSLPRTSRRWDRAEKAWRVCPGAKPLLFAALKRAFAGAIASGPRGLFTL